MAGLWGCRKVRKNLDGTRYLYVTWLASGGIPAVFSRDTHLSFDLLAIRALPLLGYLAVRTVEDAVPNGNIGGAERRYWTPGRRCRIEISDVLKHDITQLTELVVIAVGLST